jgi:hypothetical protein
MMGWESGWSGRAEVLDLWNASVQHQFRMPEGRDARAAKRQRLSLQHQGTFIIE